MATKTVDQIKEQLRSNLAEAKEEYEDHWLSWTTVWGDKYEGVLLEVDEDTHYVLCTDGIVRAA